MTTTRLGMLALSLLLLDACAAFDDATAASAVTLPTASGDDMQPGEGLAVGDSLTSSDGAYTLAFESDGNLVLYRNADKWPLWDLGSDTATGVLFLQADGDLVLYAPGAEWSTGTGGHPGARLIVQNDGNVVLYGPGDVPLWDTGTDQTDLPSGPTATGADMIAGETLRPGEFVQSKDRRFRLLYRSDGDLVLYRRADRAVLWSSGTFDPGGVLILQGDGNLVIYSPLAIWASHTIHPGARLIVQNDGNVVLYAPDDTPLWDTGTAEP